MKDFIYIQKIQLKKFATNTDANIAIMAGFVLPVLISASALAIDMASAYLERRTAQSIVDLAAINAANHIDNAEAAAQATLDANNFGKLKALIITKGRYTADPALAASERFKPGEAPFNAVQVTLSKDARLYFARTLTKAPFEIRVAAVAGTANEATFSIGSRLAALRGGVANKILNKLLGTSVELSVMDYEQLASAQVRVDDFLNALDTSASLNAASFSDVLDANVTMNDVVAAASTASHANGDQTAALLLKHLTGSFASSLKVPLHTLIDLGPYAALEIGKRTPGLSSTLSILDVLRACAMIANGERQIAINLNLGLPGVAALSLDLAVGERKQHVPWVSIGQNGASVSTSQTKLRLVAQVLGTGPLESISIRLPIYLELAYADATLTGVACGATEADRSATVAVRPGIARAAIADVTDNEMLNSGMWNTLRKAEIVRTPLLKILAKAIVDVGNQSATALQFDQSDVDDNEIKRVNTNEIVGSVVSSLLEKSSFDISALGIINISLVTPAALRSILKPVASTLDPIVAEILKTVGISLGEADVGVHGIRCGGSNLSG